MENTGGPNDDKQNEMLDIFHHCATVLLDEELNTAPIPEDPQNIIDIGTGAGLWAIDFADKFPNYNVIGIDLSPIQPSWIPPNLRFDIEVYTKGWTYKSNHFDYVHIRWLTGTTKDWTASYKQAYRCLKSGSYIEHMDASGTIYSEDETAPLSNDLALVQWGKIWQEAGRKSGNPIDLLERNLLEQSTKEAGFVNITKKDYPVNCTSLNHLVFSHSPSMDQEQGRKLLLANSGNTIMRFQFRHGPKTRRERNPASFSVLLLQKDLEGICQYMFGTVMGWGQEQINMYLTHLRKELNNMSLHALIDFRVVYAQKPHDA